MQNYLLSAAQKCYTALGCFLKFAFSSVFFKPFFQEYYIGSLDPTVFSQASDMIIYFWECCCSKALGHVLKEQTWFSVPTDDMVKRGFSKLREDVEAKLCCFQGKTPCRAANQARACSRAPLPRIPGPMVVLPIGGVMWVQRTLSAPNTPKITLSSPN